MLYTPVRRVPPCPPLRVFLQFRKLLDNQGVKLFHLPFNSSGVIGQPLQCAVDFTDWPGFGRVLTSVATSPA